MSKLSIVATTVALDDATISRLTDLEIGPDGLLYGTTHYDGALIAWDISGQTNLSEEARSYHQGDAFAGGVPAITFVAGRILTGGGQDGALVFHEPGATEAGTPVTGASLYPAGLTDLASMELVGGNTVVYGGYANADGIARLVMDTDGTVISEQRIFDAADTHAHTVTALEATLVDGQNMLFSASGSENGVTAWAIDGSGDLTALSSKDNDDGLWIADPTALETVTLDGVTYLIVAAAGSGSLSVMRVDDGGALAITDHLLDNLDMRFDGVTSLATVTHNGQAFIVAGGSDDGISVLSLLPDGRLLHRASLEDTGDTKLTNISSLIAKSSDDGIAIFASSATEQGVTRLFFETGPAGQTLEADVQGGIMTGGIGADLLEGRAGADQINGAQGDDILMDGAGQDILTGGDGTDFFVLAYDATRDTITDFTPGTDKIDLGEWPMLRDVSQLTFTQASDGVLISYGSDSILVRQTGSDPLLIADLQTGDIVISNHMMQDLPTGYPGPAGPDPDLPDRPAPDDTTTPTPTPDQGAEQIGGRSDDRIDGTALDDRLWGQSGNDRIDGGAGKDLIDGGTGADIINGGDGDDLIYGGSGRETDWTLKSDPDNQADDLRGDAGNDQLFGQAGADRLDGGAGDDTLTGGGGRDTFIFGSGRDVITDFTAGTDMILIDDALMNGSRDIGEFIDLTADGVVLDFANGNVLTLSGVTDSDDLAGQVDFF